MPEAPRLARRLQEGTGDVEELGNFQQEGIMTAIGLDFAEPGGDGALGLADAGGVPGLLLFVLPATYYAARILIF